MSDEENPDSLLLICVYCGKFKNDDGYWEYLSTSLKSSSENMISHGMCPDCLQEHFPDQFSSLCKEGKMVVKKMISPDNKALYGCFLIVNNMGYNY